VLAKRKLPFMQKWANKYGLNGVDAQGRTADEVWRQTADRVYSVGSPAARAKAAISAPKAPQKPAAQSGVVERRRIEELRQQMRRASIHDLPFRGSRPRLDWFGSGANRKSKETR